MTQVENSGPSARERLRSETRPKHAALDLLLGQLRPFASVERYAIYLLGMRELYSKFGGSLDRCAELAQLPPRRSEMIAAIDSDLSACGAGAEPSATDGADDIAASSDSAAWGAAYVLEGSAMGAQMLVRSAREKLPSSVTTEFLSALAGDGVGRFRAFCAAMEAGDVNGDQAVAAAGAVFEHAADWYRASMNTASPSLRESNLAT